MKNDTDNSFISSTAKALINDWQALRNIIEQISRTPKEQLDNNDPDALLKILSDTQIEDAFRGPLHPLIHQLTHAYSLISEIKTRLIITQDDNLKPHVQDSGFNLPDDLNKEINAAALDKKQRELDEAARHHHQQWQTLITTWQENLMKKITDNDLALSETEIHEMQQVEPLSELINRFTDLKLTLPKMKKKAYGLSDYFMLKVILCIHTALGRQHVANIDEELQKRLKKLKEDFKTITKEEMTLIEQQHTDINTLMKL